MKSRNYISIFFLYVLFLNTNEPVYALTESCKDEADYYLFTSWDNGPFDVYINGIEWNNAVFKQKHKKITSLIKSNNNSILISYNKDLSEYSISLIEACGERRNEIISFHKNIEKDKKVKSSYNGKIDININFDSIFTKNHIDKITAKDIDEIKEIISNKYKLFLKKGISAVRNTCIASTKKIKNQFLDISEEESQKYLEFILELEKSFGFNKLDNPSKYGETSLNMKNLGFHLLHDSVYVSTPTSESMYKLKLEEGSVGTSLNIFRKTSSGWDCIHDNYQ